MGLRGSEQRSRRTKSQETVRRGVMPWAFGALNSASAGDRKRSLCLHLISFTRQVQGGGSISRDKERGSRGLCEGVHATTLSLSGIDLIVQVCGD